MAKAIELNVFKESDLNMVELIDSFILAKKENNINDMISFGATIVFAFDNGMYCPEQFDKGQIRRSIKESLGI